MLPILLNWLQAAYKDMLVFSSHSVHSGSGLEDLKSNTPLKIQN